MGSLDSEIDETTHDVLLRGRVLRREPHLAHEPQPLASSPRRPSVTSASVDRTRCPEVSRIAAALFEQLLRRDGGLGGDRRLPPCPWSREPSRCARRAPVPSLAPRSRRTSCARVSHASAGTVADGEDGVLAVTVPTNRPDLEREIDLIEEIVRLWGMDRVPATIPAAKNHIGGLTHDQRLVREIGQIMRACGLNETLSYAFAAPRRPRPLRYDRRGARRAGQDHAPARGRAVRDAPHAAAGPF